MEITNILNKATCFLIDPSNNEHSPVEQGLAWVTTIAVAILSLGIIHALSIAWRHLQRVEKNDTHEKISKIFQELLGPKQNEQLSNLHSHSLEDKQSVEDKKYDSLVKTIENSSSEVGSLSCLLPDTIERILSFTNDVTFSRLTTASVGIIKKTSAFTGINAINQIRDLIEAAIQIDYKIKVASDEKISILGTNESLSYQRTTFFKFDSSKWEGVLKDLKVAMDDKKIVINSSALIEECKQDLLEALAEYNIDSSYILGNYNARDKRLRLDNYIENLLPHTQRQILGEQVYWKQRREHANDFDRANRYLSKLFENSQFDETLSFSAQEILNEAKKTSKFFLRIIEFKDLAETRDAVKLINKEGHSPFGPYFEIGVYGTECQHAKLPSYLALTQDSMFLHFDSLIGKKQGDRVIVPIEEGKTFIIRMGQIFPDNLEERLLVEVCESEVQRKLAVIDLDKKIASIKDKTSQQFKFFSLFNYEEDVEENKKISEQLESLENQKKEVLSKHFKERKELFQKLEKVYGKEKLERYMKAHGIQNFLQSILSKEPIIQTLTDL